ncbi:hypothetical protein SCYAM73S_00703 [Streptomyces cyaneofuscatus]
MVPGDPSAFTSTGLIHLRPYSVAKNRPSREAGNFTAESRSGSKSYTGPAIGDSEPPPNSGGEPASPAYRIQAGWAGGRVARPVLRKELFAGPAAQSYFAPAGPLGKAYSPYVSVGVLVPVQYGQPKLPGSVTRLNSTWPLGPRFGSVVPASGP